MPSQLQSRRRCAASVALRLALLLGLPSTAAQGPLGPPTQSTTSTESVSTTTGSTTSTIDPCPNATTACACADALVCGWATAANGGGTCFNVGGKGHIDCHTCSTQSHCASIQCPGLTSACSCAGSPGCRWDVTSRNCVPMISALTDCSACPTQSHCDVEPPVPTSFSPRNGGSHGSGSELRIVIWFSSEAVNWCEDPFAVGDEISFWCEGSVSDKSVSRSHVTFTGGRMLVDMTPFLSQFTLDASRTCGLSIGQGRICDEDGIPYGGLGKGKYSFRVQDQERPQLLDFDPNSMSVPVALDGSVKLFFSETVKLNPDAPKAELSRLEVDSSGTTAPVQRTTFALQAPHAEIFSSSLLVIHLGGKLRAGQLYTLSLPEGAVQDLAGNPCRDLPADAYRFRAATSALRVQDTSVDAGASTAIGMIVLVVLLSVVCLIACGIGAVKLYKAHSDKLMVYLHSADDRGPAKPARSAPVGNVSSATTAGKPATFATANEAAESAYRAAAAAAERLRQDQEADTGPSATWAQRPMNGAKAGNSGQASQARPSPSAKVHPGREGFNAGQKRRATPGNQPGGEGPKPQSSSPAPQAAESSAPPEVKAVEKQLHAMMDKPIDTRKKRFKELLVEYHPDKNSAAHAKEVFQYVNNARGWFLADA